MGIPIDIENSDYLYPHHLRPSGRFLLRMKRGKRAPMGFLRKNIFTVIIAVLFIVVFIFYNVYTLNLADNFLREKADGRRMLIDLICDVAEAGGSREALISAVTEIVASGNRVTYAAVFKKTNENKSHNDSRDDNAKYTILSERSPYFTNMRFNPLAYPDFERDIRLNNRGRYEVLSEAPGEAPPHVVNVYFRWVFRDTDEPLLVIVGVSKYAIETDIDGGLRTGAWLIASAFIITGVTSVIHALRKKRGRGHG